MMFASGREFIKSLRRIPCARCSSSLFSRSLWPTASRPARRGSPGPPLRLALLLPAGRPPNAAVADPSGPRLSPASTRWRNQRAGRGGRALDPTSRHCAEV